MSATHVDPGPSTELALLPPSGLPALCAVCFLDNRTVGSIALLAGVQVCGWHASPDTFHALLRIRALLRTEGLIR